jgi:exopolysaccharide biosynthesis WecB/TagA/CpsF family protein
MTARRPVPRLDFLGLSISDVGLSDAANAIAERDPHLPFVYVVTPNAQHMVRLAGRDPLLMSAYDKAWLVLSDGNVVRRLARLLLGRHLPHASGSDLTVELLRHRIQPDDAVTVIGGGPALEAALIAQFGLKRLAVHDPPYGFIRDPAAVDACVDYLAAHPARYNFLAVGSPQSEIVARKAFDRGTLVGVGLCIGGSLLFATGLVKRAPRWAQQFGLEGIYRLAQRPKTHFRRVFIESLPIVWIILRSRFGGAGILPPAASVAPDEVKHSG